MKASWSDKLGQIGVVPRCSLQSLRCSYIFMAPDEHLSGKGTRASRQSGKHPAAKRTLIETPAGEGRFEVMSVRHDKLLFFGLIGLVTLLFFLHVPNGGFQARNGPTTPVNNLRAALVGLLLLLAAGTTSVFINSSLNSMLGHISPVFLHSPAACSIGIFLRC
jgi:hypothetical protein